MIRRALPIPLLIAAATVQASPPATGPVETAQALFDVMAKHDATAGQALFTAEATMSSVHDDGKATVVPAAEWLTRIGSSKDQLLERMWNPKVLQHGSIAVVWADYDFHRNGQFHHCGVDSFTLIKSEGGWKISSVAYTSETSGCASSPLGPPE